MEDFGCFILILPAPVLRLLALWLLDFNFWGVCVAFGDLGPPRVFGCCRQNFCQFWGSEWFYLALGVCFLVFG